MQCHNTRTYCRNRSRRYHCKRLQRTSQSIRAKSANSTSSNDELPPLLRIQAKIRQVIYEHVFDGPLLLLADSTDLRCQTSNFFQVLYGGGYKASMPFPEEDKIFTQGRFPGLLETCHQLRDEALPVFSGRLAVASLPIRSRSTKSSTALGRIPAHYVQSVKDIFLPWDIIDEKLRLNDIFPSLDTIHLVCADKNVLIPDSMDEARNVNAIHGAITNLKKRTTQYPQWLPHQVRWIGHGTRVRDLYDGGMLKCYIKVSPNRLQLPPYSDETQERGDVHFSGDIDSVGTPPKVAITPVAFWSHSLQADLGRYLTQMIDYSDDEIAVLNISVETDETCTVNGRACQTIYGLRRQYPMFIAASSFYRQSIFTDRERWDTERERWDYLLQRRSFADFASCI